ncbi:CGNR zinc finger domain-containing protein [Actinomadura rupiterrae]|uniref:CGNR zinc finger domain-containing protein n=1 Tax=Actinomadura rupiterrae TaxID=559627 RepID=UPI0020A2DD03|nr:CGNR zinc finger domain-containing protein [Actinomadura rupiterrae]MCP2340070.1 putative RNA-binding Zn ribbon-like protein [Actinomadura rupiterrae]
MDLASYADLAIILVNSDHRAGGDRLRDVNGLRELLAGRPHLGGRPRPHDLDAMRQLRAQLRAVFAASARGEPELAADLLNELLIQHPVHPQLSAHDGQDWHLHLNDSGAIPDVFAARAAMGLAVRVAEQGIDRLRLCAAETCGRAFLAAPGERSGRYCSAECAARRTSAAAAAGVPPRPRVSADLDTPPRGITPAHRP